MFLKGHSRDAYFCGVCYIKNNFDIYDFKRRKLVYGTPLFVIDFWSISHLSNSAN